MLQACMFNLYSPIAHNNRSVFSQFAINAGGILFVFSELYFHSGMVLSCYEAVSLILRAKGRTENICLLSALPGLLSAIYVFPIMFRTLFHII